MSASCPQIHVVLLAGGKGLRVGGDVPKQFRETSRGVLFTVSLASFLDIPAEQGQIASVTVTVPDAWREQVGQWLLEVEKLKGLPVQMAPAGETRTASTWNALCELEKLGPGPEDLVAVHDAARPFAGEDLLGRLASAAAEHGGAVPGIEVADTVVQMDGQAQASYLNRSQLRAVQTPQVFRWNWLQPAHAWAAAEGTNFTDDGGLMAARGHDPQVVEGDVGNWKVTTEGDWQRALGLLGETSK